ncbi:RsmF rRNA methyltransferase first C-terminal domain-containing protein [Companilactobacillus crustorum]|uniref:RsmB/NOP family class I SAM-dependent RNA methyltransferase n=1 Tax=Companilactobacillus crustorum TaxID=392416 RepID=UPI000ECD2372|nr:RsmB/NOP family class I SAM-dependent RNA methyltransferase [Companilactobacillus crustorum]WDT66602.1 RsmF rRNA methyltransferase first C-terminal domain-containing protein [Companilactobacillus crustorum]HCD08023.1 RNA methyltransferase [Lactobacillus sp.]
MKVDLSQDFKTKYRNLMGDRADKLFAAIQEDSQEAFRLNPLKANFQNVSYSLERPIEYSPIGYYGEINGNSIDHLSGYVYSQEPSAMYVTEILDPQENNKILDLCAAPGSKTTYIASKMASQGLLVSNEINAKRAKVLSSNIERMGITNTIVTNNSPKDFEKKLGQYFDKILVDAPCSGEGMFRKDPDSVQYWSLDYVEQCANRQRHILDSAYKLLNNGGTFVYSTCTFSPEENEQNIDWFLDKYPDMHLVLVKKYAGMEDGRPEWGNNNSELTKALRMFPDQFNGEGHFMCKMVKDGEPAAIKERQINNGIKKDDTKFVQKFAKANLKTLSENNWLKINDFLYQAASLDSRFKGLHILRNGLKLGEFKKNRFEPDIAWILAIKPDELNTVFELDQTQFEKYLHGESVILTSKPDFDNKWIGLAYQDKLFSWGRYSNQQIKNVYPKGLRR